MEKELVGRTSNYRKHVEWVINTYESEGMGFVHGFQKDAIQNAVGARKRTSSFDGWKCVIDVKDTSKGRFVIVEDFGTVGLTGENYPFEKLKEFTDNNIEIPANQRLARISVDNSSGGDSTSAGLFGVGKTLYVAASNDCRVYFDSITENEGYRCNVNDNNNMIPQALEGEEAKNYIREKSGLAPIDHVGTRFIIANPIPELVDAIFSGKLLANVEETWWRIIKRMPSVECGIFIGGTRASVPDAYDFDESKDFCEKDSYFSKSPMLADPSSPDYRSKKFGFFIKENIPDDQTGFYFYRRGMKIGRVQMDDLEILFSKPYFGFIELDEGWENELAKYENATHYDCKSSKKNSSAYKNLKLLVKRTVDELLRQWGYKKDRENRNKALSKMVETIQEELSDLLAANGFESTGKGDRKNKIDIRLSDVSYPNENDPKNARSLYTGESLSFKYTVFNRMTRTAGVQVMISTVRPDNSQIAQLDLKNEEIEAGQTYESSFVFTPTAENSDENSINGLLISVKLANDSKVVTRKLIYYFKAETEIREDLDFELGLHSYQFPDLPNKGRRVDTEESISGISYSLVSRLNRPVKVMLRVMALDAANNNEPITTVFEHEYTLPANGEPLISDPFNIIFSKEIFYPKIHKGIITVRAKMGLHEMLPECLLRKGTVLDEYEFKVSFNKPEKSGPELNIRLLEEPETRKRSWILETEKDTIAINISHPEYVSLNNDLLKEEEYIMKQATRESVYLYASQGKFDEEFGPNISSFEYLKKANDKVEELIYQICQK